MYENVVKVMKFSYITQFWDVNVREYCQGSELQLYNSVLGCECTRMLPR
jgi:hypothetical protein